MIVKQGSGPNRGRSPVEWEEIPSVRPSIGPPRDQGGPSQALESQILALGGPSQAVGGQSQEDLSRAQGSLHQALGGLC